MYFLAEFSENKRRIDNPTEQGAVANFGKASSRGFSCPFEGGNLS